MRVYVGSSNIVKINAVKSVLKDYEVIGVDVNSNVSKQPLSDEETLNGAINRAKNLPSSSLRIGLEAGVSILNDELYLINYGVLITPNNTIYKAGGTKIPLPNIIKECILNEKLELSECMHKIYNKEDIKHQEGAIGFFTNNLVKRIDIFKHIVKLLYGQYLKEENNGK